MPNESRRDNTSSGIGAGEPSGGTTPSPSWRPSDQVTKYIIGAFVMGLVLVALPWSAVDYAKLTILESVGIEIKGSKLRHEAIAKMIENDPQLLTEVLGRIGEIEEPADKIARPVVENWPKDTAKSLTRDGGTEAISGLGEVRFFSADNATMIDHFKADVEAKVSKMTPLERNQYLNGLEQKADALGSFIRLWRAKDSPFRSQGEIRRITAPAAGTAPDDCTLHMYGDEWAEFGNFVRVENVESDDFLYLKVTKSMGPKKEKPNGTDIHVSPRDLRRLGLSEANDQAYVQSVSESDFRNNADRCASGQGTTAAPPA